MPIQVSQVKPKTPLIHLKSEITIVNTGGISNYAHYTGKTFAQKSLDQISTCNINVWHLVFYSQITQTSPVSRQLNFPCYNKCLQHVSREFCKHILGGTVMHQLYHRLAAAADPEFGFYLHISLHNHVSFSQVCQFLPTSQSCVSE